MYTSHLTPLLLLLLSNNGILCQDDVTNATSRYTIRNATFSFNDASVIRGLSKLQIRSRFKSAISIHESSEYGVSVSLLVNGSDVTQVGLVGAAIDIMTDDHSEKTLVLQIDVFPDYNMILYTIYGVVPAGIILLAGIIGVVCWHKHRNKAEGPRRQIIGSQIHRLQQRFRTTITSRFGSRRNSEDVVADDTKRREDEAIQPSTSAPQSSKITGLISKFYTSGEERNDQNIGKHDQGDRAKETKTQRSPKKKKVPTATLR